MLHYICVLDRYIESFNLLCQESEGSSYEKVPTSVVVLDSVCSQFWNWDWRESNNCQGPPSKFLQTPFFLMMCFSHDCIIWCEFVAISITTPSRNSMKFIVSHHALLRQEADKLSSSHPTGWSLDALHRSVNKRLKLGWTRFLQGTGGWKISRSHFGHLQTQHNKHHKTLPKNTKNLQIGGSFWSLTLLGGQLQCNKSLALQNRTTRCRCHVQDDALALTSGRTGQSKLDSESKKTALDSWKWRVHYISIIIEYNYNYNDNASTY